jgi:hypothetical protein
MELKIKNYVQLTKVLNDQVVDLRKGVANVEQAREVVKTAKRICNLAKLAFEYQKHIKTADKVNVDFLND